MFCKTSALQSHFSKMARIMLAVLTVFFLLAVSIDGNRILKERSIIPKPKLTCKDIKCPKGYQCELRECSSKEPCGSSICCRPNVTVSATAPGKLCEPLDFIRNINMCPRGYHVDRVLSVVDKCCWNVNCTECPVYKCPSCCFSETDEYGCSTCICGIVPCPPT